MNSQIDKNGVKSHQITIEEGFYGNGNSKRSNTTSSLRPSFIFYNWSVSKRITRNIFFRVLPLVRFLLNAREGIKKLESLDIKEPDGGGGEQRRSTLQKGDTGFKELAKVLIENRVVDGKVKKIYLIETEASLTVGRISPKVYRVLVIVVDGKSEVIETDPFDPAKSIRELTNWVEDSYRKQLANWMIVLVIIWLVANSYMLYWLNK